jgi:DNA-binding IclR family transcriptional regulator
MDETKDRRFVAALARGMSVLRCFTPATPELGASEIARMTSMPQPTVWRLCYTLQQLGHLVSVPGRQSFRPGIPLLGLGLAVMAGQPIAEIAAPYLQELATRLEGTVSLGARDGLKMIYLQRFHGTGVIIFNDMRVGSRLPIATSGTGWAYLAGLETGERSRLLGELGKDDPEHWPQIEPHLNAELAAFSTAGFVKNVGVLHPRINAVAVPIASPDGATVLSLSAGGISQIFAPERLNAIGHELKALAAQLTPALAFKGVV